MINPNTITVPITATPTRTGSASAGGTIPAAFVDVPGAASPPLADLAASNDGSGSISVPTRVPGAVAKP